MVDDTELEKIRTLNEVMLLSISNMSDSQNARLEELINSQSKNGQR
jgi:hypothetical protein